MKNMTDIGVMIPTLNSMPAIQAHVSKLNEWIHHVGQVIVVDSESTDGTIEYIRENLAHDHIVYINRPRGLYQSWNEGISHIQKKYTYISTVGDLISGTTLKRLYELAEKNQVAVVLSPPRLVDTRGKRLTNDWPIHQFIKNHVTSSTYHLSAIERLVCSCLYLPGTLMGSSASNLYLTKCLLEAPFPTDYGHCGDSIWALTRPLDEDWLIFRDMESTFLVHKKMRSKNYSPGAYRANIYGLAEDQLLKMKASVSGKEMELVEYCHRELSSFWARKEAVMSQYRAIKAGAIPWYLSPKGWSIRREKYELNDRIKEIQRKVKNALLISKSN